jgi:hypothetical protein
MTGSARCSCANAVYQGADYGFGLLSRFFLNADVRLLKIMALLTTGGNA